MLRAFILSIGSELTQGHLTDTNATFLAQELNAIGADLMHVVQCGDNRPRLVRQLQRALDESDLVICTGGIGPTEDDLTREAIAEVVDETPVIDEQLLAEIREFFHIRGLTMPDRNAKQAWTLPSNETLPNPIGTAPGWFVVKNGKAIVAMPGVPREMKRMWTEQALPRINEQLSGDTYSAITIKTIGIGESALEDSISDLVVVPNPIVATYAKDHGVEVRITGIADTLEEAQLLRQGAESEIRKRLGKFIYGIDGDSLPAVLARQIRRQGYRLAINDHGGGGLFASMMLGDPEAAEVVAAAIATPSDDLTATELAAACASYDPPLLGLAIAVRAERTSNTSTGQIDVVLSQPFATVEQFTVRSSFAEIQRRSVLVASDVIHRNVF